MSAVFLFCCILLISVSSAFGPRTQEYGAASTDLPLITSQYTDMGSLNFSSDGEFQVWANLNALSGDGSLDTPYYFTRLNITSESESSLKLSNIRNNHFTFDDCIFQTHQSNYALDLFNVTKGHFTGCSILGATFHNYSDFNVIMRSYIADEVYFLDSLHTGFYHNSVDVNSPVSVMSFSRISTNVSFFDNDFLSDLDLSDCTECNVIYNRFFSSVRDNGYANIWDGNSYADYVGVGHYLIIGTAGSIDSNPTTLETSTIVGTENTTTFTTGTRTTTTTSNLTDNPFDDVLIGIIGFEIVLVILLVNIRKQSNQ
jgi:hypothetical protein